MPSLHYSEESFQSSAAFAQLFTLMLHITYIATDTHTMWLKKKKCIQVAPPR